MQWVVHYLDIRTLTFCGKAQGSVVGADCRRRIVNKIYVEGHELSVLKGGGSVLATAAVEMVEQGDRQEVRE